MDSKQNCVELLGKILIALGWVGELQLKDTDFDGDSRYIVIADEMSMSMIQRVIAVCSLFILLEHNYFQIIMNRMHTYAPTVIKIKSGVGWERAETHLRELLTRIENGL